MKNLKDEQRPTIDSDNASAVFAEIYQTISSIGEQGRLQTVIFDELEGKQIPYELIRRRREAVEYTPEGILLPHTLAVRIGNMIFLDSRLREHLSANLINTKTADLFWLFNFFSHLDDFALRQYSLPTSYALSGLPLTGKHVLDLGAADGTQSLVAHKNGARKVTAVENNKRFSTQEIHHDKVLFKTIFDANIVFNGMNPDDFSYVHADISTDQETILNSARNADVVVANIGPGWWGSDIPAIDLLQDLPCVTTYILAGYVNNRSGWGEDLTKALDLLATYGFTPRRSITTNVFVQTFVLERSL